MQENSDQGFNLAPQIGTFNTPAYYNIFEEVIQNTEAKKFIEVELTYDNDPVRIDQLALKNNGLINNLRPDIPWEITFPRRIPKLWRAKAETAPTPEGATPTGLFKKDLKSDSETVSETNLVLDNAKDFEEIVIDSRGENPRQKEFNSFKVHMVEGVIRNSDNSLSVGGGQKLEFIAEQQIFRAPDITPRSEAENGEDFKLQDDIIKESLDLKLEVPQIVEDWRNSAVDRLLRREITDGIAELVEIVVNSVLQELRRSKKIKSLASSDVQRVVENDRNFNRWSSEILTEVINEAHIRVGSGGL
jgi:hypothetical protein